MNTPEGDLEALAEELARYAGISLTEARDRLTQIQKNYQPRALQPITIWPQTIKRITK